MNHVSLFCTIELEPPIGCASDALGTSIPVVVGAVTGTLEMPSLPAWENDPSDPLHMPLIPPRSAETWKQGDSLIQWGFPSSYPSGNARVSKVLLHFQTASERLNETATAIHRDTNRWYASFVDYFELISKQRRAQSLKVLDRLPNVDLFCWGPEGKPQRPYEKLPIRVEIRMPAHDQLLDRDRLCSVCSFASAAKPVALEYRIQLEAYRALYQGDYRKAIIETAVAAELALTVGIRNRLASDHVAYGDKLLKKFRMLGGRLELARIVGLELPLRDLENDLVEPRNSVIHKAYFVDEALGKR